MRKFNMSFDKEYSLKKDHFEEILNSFTASLENIPEPLLSSVVYSLSSGGKRLRPVLLLASAEAFGAKEDQSIRLLALAVECIHTYSLIHDDLPCMDNADLRRDKPTNHKVYGESVAVLAGDALLNLAYELLFKAIIISPNENKECLVKAGRLIAEKCGATGLIGGQVADTVVGNSKHISTKLNYIYQHKTADLISSALAAGAIAAGASESDIEKIGKVGDEVGYAFQIVDDLLDAENGEDEGKCTFAGVYGNNECRKTVADKTALALDMLSGLNGDFSFIHSLIKNLSLRKA